MNNKLRPGTIVKCKEENNVLVIKTIDSKNKKLYCAYAGYNDNKNLGESFIVNMDDVKVIRTKDGNKNPIKITFLKPSFNVNKKDNIVKCELNYIINFNELFSNGITFTKKIIHRTIMNYLPNFNKSDNVQILVEFLPKKVVGFKNGTYMPMYGKTGVLYINEENNKVYEWSNNNYKELLVNNVDGERKYYKYVNVPKNYNSSSKIVTFAKCHDKDNFDEKLGKNIALSKAKRNVYKIVRNISNDIYNQYNSLFTDLFLLSKHMDYQYRKQNTFIQKHK